VDANSFSLEDSKGNGEYGKDGNLTGRWTPADDDLAIPEPDSAIVVSITKSKDLYEEDLKVALRKIDVVEGEIKAINTRTKEFTAQTTGTDELNKYVQPGLYQLYEQEFGAQREIKKEIEEIKPYWSQAIEKAFLLKDRRIDLEKQRDTLLKGLPPHLKDNKKK
jgi:choline kinase